MRHSNKKRDNVAKSRPGSNTGGYMFIDCLLLFLRLVPSSGGRRNGHRRFIHHRILSSAIFLSSPTVFMSLSTASIHIVLGLFPGGFMSTLCLNACSSGRLLTCPNHFNGQFA